MQSNDIATVQENLETSSQRTGQNMNGDTSLGLRLQSRRESTRLERQQTVTRFIERQQTKIREKQEQTKLRETIEGKSSLFAEEFRKQEQHGKQMWIMKPVSGSRGIGIFIISRLSQVRKWDSSRLAQGATPKPNYVVSRYIADPLLIGG